MPITKSQIDDMPANSKIWDSGRGAIPGFGVRKQTRRPAFVLKYSVGGRQHWHTIGKFGAPWTVDQARGEAKRLLGLIASGVDPSKKTDGHARMTVSTLCDEYMSAADAGAILTRFNRPKKASTLGIDKGRISRHIKPLIGDELVANLDSRAIRRMIDDITTGKTAQTLRTKSRGRAVVTGGASTAARVADLLSGIMSWAVENGVVDRNPVHKVRRYRSAGKQRFLSASELARLGSSLFSGRDVSGRPIHPHALSVLKLLCLTGCRVGEIVGLRWSEVDFEQGCLRLEDTKTGSSLRAVGIPALNLLRVQSRMKGCPFVFPGATGEAPYQGMGKLTPKVFEVAEIADATPHVLRHTFASIASELGYSDGTIAGLLGHKGRGVTSRYVHRPDQALALAAEEVAKEIERQLDAHEAHK